MQVHEKIAELRHKKGLTQEQLAEKIHMEKDGYGKLERGERQLRVPRLKQIATALGMELKEIVEGEEKTVLNASFHGQTCYKNQKNYVNSDKEMARELEISRLLIEQQQREIELLKEQVNQLKEMIELMKK